MIGFVIAILIQASLMFGAAWLVAWTGLVPVIGITPYKRMPKWWREENKEEDYEIVWKARSRGN